METTISEGYIPLDQLAHEWQFTQTDLEKVLREEEIPIFQFPGNKRHYVRRKDVERLQSKPLVIAGYIN